MAALEVVHRRLKKAGLDDFCLELHSNKANKKDALKSFGQAYARTRTVQDPVWQARSQDISNQRVALNSYVRALHLPRVESDFAGACWRQGTPRDPQKWSAVAIEFSTGQRKHPSRI